VYPFALSGSGFKTTTELKVQLEQLLLKLETLQHAHQFSKAAQPCTNSTTQIPVISKFHRASSAVEGRNGYLSFRHHVARGFQVKHLQVLTVIHNFDVQALMVVLLLNDYLADPSQTYLIG